MNIYSLDQIVAMAKYTSPIYKDFYRDVEPGSALTSLPILSNEQLMEIVHAQKPDFVFAEGNTHGLIFESSASRSEEHTSELQSRENLVCRLLLEKKKKQ